MTFFEKWKEEHPGPHVGMGHPPDCPSHYGYEDVPPCDHGPFPCIDCWNREIPEKPKEKKKTIYAHVGPFDDDKYDKVAEFATLDTLIPNAAREAVGLPKIAKQDIPENISAEDVDKVLNAIKNGLREELNDKPHILDSGARREFGTGAVRDIQEGKGRCDLLPLDVVAVIYAEESEVISWIFDEIHAFKQDGGVGHLFGVINYFRKLNWWDCCETMLLEVSIHFEEGAKKYGENNWQKGIPVHCYIDSAVRHYLKFLRGDKDEPHDRAFCWNIMCAIWTCKHKPELNDYTKRDTSEVEAVMG